jgi:GNAT superfamily N-acetyltransferase
MTSRHAVSKCFAGGRQREWRALRSEDADVWLVSCFFVRVGYRRSGITTALLRAAVVLAERYRAPAIEGFPLAGDGPHIGDRFLGTEPLFAACGFTCIARPTPSRAVMRRDLHSP